MAAGMAGKRMDSLVPRITSWMLTNTTLSEAHRTLDTRVWSDFLRKDWEDMLCAVRLRPCPCLASLVKTFGLPFSKSHGCSCWIWREPIAKTGQNLKTTKSESVVYSTCLTCYGYYLFFFFACIVLFMNVYIYMVFEFWKHPTMWPSTKFPKYLSIFWKFMY